MRYALLYNKKYIYKQYYISYHAKCSTKPLQIINIYSISRKTGLPSGCDTNYSKGDVKPM
jgi:hypothetical protein